MRAWCRRDIRCASPARIAAAARSFTGTRCCTIKPPAAATSRCSIWRRNQPTFTVTDSVLSEEAVMGFEYGFSTTEPHCLTIWEGAVRRLLQRRAGHHRSVHQFRRSQMGPPVRHHPVPAAWLRGSGARAFLGAPRALPAAVRRIQHAGVRAVDAGADVSYAAPANGAAAAQAAHRHDAEELAAPPLVGVAARRARHRRVLHGDRRDRRPQALRRDAHRACAAARCISTC